MRRLSTTAAAVAAVATLGVGAGTAYATTSTTTSGSTTSKPAAKAPATLQQVQARAAAAISTRVTDLTAEITKVQAATDLGADQAALLKTLQGDTTGLQALGRKIAADTTASTARSDTATIFTGYRVIALALPVARLVLATDRIDTTTLPRANALEGKLASKVTPANTAQLTPLVTAVKADLAAAGTSTSGVAAKLLTLTPASWNADHHVLDGPRAQVKSAVADLKKAAAAAKQARGDLRAARGATGGHHAKAAASAASPTPSAG